MLVATTNTIVYTCVDIETITYSTTKNGTNMKADSVMDNIRNAFECSEMTLGQLGEGLGYDGPTARKRAWFLLYRTSDPRISTVLAVAQTLGVKISDLVK